MNWSRSPMHNRMIESALALQAIKKGVDGAEPFPGVRLYLDRIEAWDYAGDLDLEADACSAETGEKARVKVSLRLWKIDNADPVRSVLAALVSALPDSFFPAWGPV